MKLAFLIAAIIGVTFASPADPFRLEGPAFRSSASANVIWATPTNTLPRGLWIYRVMPQAISAAVVSNAMALGHFHMKDLSKGEHPILKDKYLIYFFNTNEFGLRRFLYIAPTLGGIEYNSESDYKNPIADVPTSDEAVALAREVLFQLGIDRSLLADKVQTGYDDTSTRIDRAGNRISQTMVRRRGVAFGRRIDGVGLSDKYCFLIHFGSHGRIEDFSLFWRNILPQESHQVATPDEIIFMIKSGKAVLPPQFDDVGGLDAAKTLSITKITPRYYNGEGKESLDFLYPYCELEMSADIGKGEAKTFYLQCPIFSTNVK